MNEYSKKVCEHSQNPKNAGTIKNADGIGEFGDPVCGDFLHVFIKIRDDIISDIKYQIYGCHASIECTNAMSKLAIGQNIDDAILLREEDMINALDELPEHK